MAIATPDTTSQVEDRIKADVQRSAVDSNPYIQTHWLRSLIAGFARRIFDFYRDLERTELRVFPDTADEETSLVWGNIYIGEQNPETTARGFVVGTGVATSVIPVGTVMTSGENDYISQSDATISDNVLSVLSITRSGATATVTINGNHNLSSFVPVSISGADQSQYNVTETEIVVTSLTTFDFQVDEDPETPATGSISASFTSAYTEVASVGFGTNVNLNVDTPLALQSPIVGVDDTLYVDFGAIGGGSNTESTSDYKERYLQKIRDPVSHLNVNDIIAIAKEVTGVTRVFVESTNSRVGFNRVSSITRIANIATVVTEGFHGLDDGQNVTISGAAELSYNVVGASIIVENDTTFHFIVFGDPATPATGAIVVDDLLALGQVRTYFMRDNDAISIPTQAEVEVVKERIDTILPANTSTYDNIVRAPSAIVVDYLFSELSPNTSTMRAAIRENIQQFHDEETIVSVNVDQDAYRAAIKNTVDTVTGDLVLSFELSSPSGDILINSGQIATRGTVAFQ